MKRMIFLLLTLFFLNNEASAQVGIGMRGIFNSGNAAGGLELSIQKLGAYEFDFGGTFDGSWKFTGLWMPLCLGKQLTFFGGMGAGIGSARGAFTANVAADLGIAFHVSRARFSLDWRPEWGLTPHSHHNTDFNWGNFALGIRFVLGK